MLSIIARVVYHEYTDTQVLDTAVILSHIFENLMWQAGEPKYLDIVRKQMQLVAVECARRGIRLAGIAGY